MLNGLYNGASALDMLARQQETIAANIAHLNTPGYRRAVLSFAQTSDTAVSAVNPPSSQHSTFKMGGWSRLGVNLTWQ